MIINDTGLSAMREVINSVQANNRKAGLKSSARAEILIHAIAVFSSRGLERTTVQHLLDAASVSRRTFYKYFQNKFDVLESLYEVCVEHMILRFRQEAESSGTVGDIIGNTFSIYFDYHLSLGPIIQLMMQEARRTESVLWPHRERAHGAVVDVFQSELSRMTGRRYAPLVFQTLIWSLESYSLHLLSDTDCSPEAVTRCKNVMTGVAEALLVHGTSPALLEIVTVESPVGA